MNSLSEFISTVPSSSLLSSSHSAKACISAASVLISSGWSCEGGSFRSPNRISGWLPLQWSTTGPSWQTQAGQCHCVWVIIGILICLCSPCITNPVCHLGMPSLPAVDQHTSTLTFIFIGPQWKNCHRSARNMVAVTTTLKFSLLHIHKKEAEALW